MGDTRGAGASDPRPLPPGEQREAGGQLPEPPPAGAAPNTAVAYSHTGQRYVLGFTSDSYGIWDRIAPAAPIALFPRGEEGWARAWGHYSALEPNGVAIGVAQSRHRRSRSHAGTNGLAIASLVMGILWLGGVGSTLAVIFGYAARSRIDTSGGLQVGRGFASTGIVLGWAGIGLGVAISLLVATASAGA